ncbi:hypothetical protein [uncultured Clostridium sp.]|uniref:hypothetical protein n=1 Tax=uncultured Clostridium sp. TaxID=59620 RepID=UPI0025D391B9|nr:hypothetical protein [uncultured Clostridium sp.]
MKKNLKKLIVFFTVIITMMGFCITSSGIRANAATYLEPNAKYNIYNLVRNASKSGGCSDMVPQGICFAGDYLLITAYCKDKSHNSVIYVFNESDKSYYGTIKLPGKAHVGGIAYDCNRSGSIWVANGEGLGCFKYSKLSECKGKVLNLGSYLREVTLKYSASTLCYDVVNDCLWVAQFSELNPANSFARCYKVENKTSNRPTLPYQFQISVPLKTQGISVRGNKMLISTSYGRKNNSKMYSYTWNQSTKKKSNEKSKVLPPMSEGVVMGSAYAYVVYESVATEYYDTCISPVKYFAQYKLSDFGV